MGVGCEELSSSDRDPGEGGAQLQVRECLAQRAEPVLLDAAPSINGDTLYRPSRVEGLTGQVG